MTRLAVIGGSGFLGSHLVAYGRAIGADITVVAMPRIDGVTVGNAAHGADAWRRSHGDEFAALCTSLEPFDVVINAAGSARPGSTDHHALFNANAVLPAIVGHAAGAAGVRRLLHISTAAVQGRLDPLDETVRSLPLTPYAASKAAAELFLLRPDERDHSDHLPPEVSVYRPTSVQGTGHPATVTLARAVAGLPAVPVAGAGDQPVPVALLENVTAGVIFAASMPDIPAVILQPYESMTTSRLLRLFGARRIVHLPPGISNPVLGQIGRMAARSPRVTAYVRWYELLLHGQAIRADALAGAGFVLVAGPDAWATLAGRTRAEAQVRASSVVVSTMSTSFPSSGPGGRPNGASGA